MDQMGEPKMAARASSGAAPSHLRWDTSELQSHRCTLATASATPDTIVLNFGAKSGRDYQGGEARAELLRRIVLSPLTAKHLLATLQRLVAEYEAPSTPSA